MEQNGAKREPKGAEMDAKLKAKSFQEASKTKKANMQKVL